ncbi:hypothetical protein [Kocuria marina]|uniref:hypothetical protein n=1 Tax=Kocuria marina TaxID=223184 RepID=UPI003460B9F4
MDTTTQREQLAQILATHRTHHTDNESWILTNYVERSGQEWPETVVLRYSGPAGSSQRAEFPGLSRETGRIQLVVATP